MQAYEINRSWQRHIVVANSMGEAEKLFNKMYGYGQATIIEKIADYVLVQGIDDKEAKP